MSSDLEDIIDETPQETPAEPEPTQEPEEQAAEAQEEQAPEPQMVPAAVVRELRQEVRNMRTQLGQQSQSAPAPMPDVLENPEGFSKHFSSHVENAVLGMKLEQSRFLAEREFGAEEVEAAYDYFNANPAQSAALLKYASPFHAAVDEYRKARIAQEVGSDPQAFREKLLKETREQVLKELQADQAKQQAAQPAPSMANISGTGGGAAANWSGPVNLDDLLG